MDMGVALLDCLDHVDFVDEQLARHIRLRRVDALREAPLSVSPSGAVIAVLLSVVGHERFDVLLERVAQLSLHKGIEVFYLDETACRLASRADNTCRRPLDRDLATF